MVWLALGFGVSSSVWAANAVKLSIVSLKDFRPGTNDFPVDDPEEAPFKKDQKPEFYVLLENTSDKPVGIYKQWSSWGYYSINFVVEEADGSIKKLGKRGRDWDKNVPDFYELPPGKSHAVPINLSAKAWLGVSQARKPGAKIKATFDQEELSNEYRSYDPWKTVKIYTTPTDSTPVLWESLNAGAPPAKSAP